MNKPPAAFAPSDRGDLPDAASLLDDPPRLRATLAADGVLLLCGLLPAPAVLAARACAIATMRAAGWLASEEPLVAHPDLPLEGDPRHREPYRRLIHHPDFAGLARTPALLAAMRALLGGEALLHRRVIGRLAPPHQPPTAPHQDYQYIRGSQGTLTAWIPLGDCPRGLGGLAALPGSHRRGFLHHVRAAGAGGLGLPATLGESGWRSADYRCGDVLVFPALTIHAALPNRAGLIRLSADFRYQRPDEPIDADSHRPHFGLEPVTARTCPNCGTRPD